MSLPGLQKKVLGIEEKEFTEDDVIRCHHLFMRSYGWIPIKEFEEIPIPTFWNLLDELNSDAKAERDSMKKMKGKK